MPIPLPFTSTADILADIGQALDDARSTFGVADFRGLTYAGTITEMTRLHARLRDDAMQLRKMIAYHQSILKSELEKPGCELPPIRMMFVE